MLIKIASEWLFNPSVYRAKGDRLVRARVLPVCDNGLSAANSKAAFFLQFTLLDKTFDLCCSWCFYPLQLHRYYSLSACIDVIQCIMHISILLKHFAIKSVKT